MVSFSAGFSFVGPSHPIITYVGDEVMLPAFLSPELNAQGFDIKWTTLKSSSPVLLYQNNSIITRIESYTGRTVFSRENLKYMSLIIRNVRVSDGDLYKCLVFSEQWEDEARINLIVEVLGSQPSISMISTQDQNTTLECSAEKWNPQPKIIWRDMNGEDMTSQSTVATQEDTEGLLTVNSVIPVKKEFNVFVFLLRSKAPKTDWPSRLTVYSFSPGVSVWLVLFWVLLAVCVAVTSLLAIQWRKMKASADVTFDPEAASLWLIVSENGKEVRHVDTRQTVADNLKRFDRWVNVLAREGFISGRHYWEVEVGEETAWDLGVTRESADRKGWINLSPYDGYWSVVLRNSNVYEACDNSIMSFSLRVKPRTVGIFLDYDEGQVSFYNAQSHSHMYTFTDSFTETLYPFFGRSLNDADRRAAPLVIRPLCTQWSLRTLTSPY
ncbi:butyrophilin subfamily 2 member A2-like [Erpetoichthys calabaricus]|uniref:butyrophilin subfamily 2 member A2-like n=1 Tax=Erpetoichthys calabaricus TaxID=27687 RepID=UPI0022348F09|nr:butyrophilin subfamily 2 member A2-like [Erpetoichthys calabaricus]